MAFRPFKKKKDFATSNEVLEKVAKNLGLDEKIYELRLLDIWQEIAGPKLAQDTFAHRLSNEKQGRMLVVGVKNAALANELQFLKEKLENKFNELAQQRLGRTLAGIIFELRSK